MASLRESQLAAQMKQRKATAQKVGGQGGKRAGQAAGKAGGAAIGGTIGASVGAPVGAIRGGVAGFAAGGVGAIPGTFIGAGQGFTQFGAQGAKAGGRAGGKVGGLVGKQTGKQLGGAVANRANKGDLNKLRLLQNRRQNPSTLNKATRTLGVNSDRNSNFRQKITGGAGSLLGAGVGSFVPIAGTAVGKKAGKIIGKSIIGKWVLICSFILAGLMSLMLFVTLIGGIMILCEEAKQTASTTGSTIGAVIGGSINPLLSIGGYFLGKYAGNQAVDTTVEICQMMN